MTGTYLPTYLPVHHLVSNAHCTMYSSTIHMVWNRSTVSAEEKRKKEKKEATKLEAQDLEIYRRLTPLVHWCTLVHSVHARPVPHSHPTPNSLLISQYIRVYIYLWALLCSTLLISHQPPLV